MMLSIFWIISLIIKRFEAPQLLSCVLKTALESFNRHAWHVHEERVVRLHLNVNGFVHHFTHVGPYIGNLRSHCICYFDSVAFCPSAIRGAIVEDNPFPHQLWNGHYDLFFLCYWNSSEVVPSVWTYSSE